MLDQVTIKNYRLFDELNINQLARVNLIVGTNNSGKSSLLEAIHLLTSDDAGINLLRVLDERGEYATNTTQNRTDTVLYDISNLFRSRSVKIGDCVKILSSKLGLELSIREEKLDSSAHKHGVSISFHDALAEGNGDKNLDARYRNSLVVQHSSEGTSANSNTFKLINNSLLRSPRDFYRYYPNSTSRMVTTNNSDIADLAELWDGITLTPKEDKVIEALRILEPQTERISFTGNQRSDSRILVRLSDIPEPVLLGSMGDGMRRALTIAASLVSVDDGTLLIDEIDTGLYYGVLKDIWRLILETSALQGAQVFATTHSWDCVRAFQQAISELGDLDAGRLIRLDKVADTVLPITYSPQELEIAMNQGVEVR